MTSCTEDLLAPRQKIPRTLSDFSVALFSDPPALFWVMPELLRSGLQLACVVTAQPRLLRFDQVDEVREAVQKRGIPFFRPSSLESPEFQDEFFKTRPSVIATMTLSRKIPKTILERVPLGGLNWHPAMLPHYRGAVPYFWPIYNGERETGITIHQMTDEFDSGDIHFRKRISIDPDDTSGSLALKCVREGIPLLLLALKELKAGRKLPRIPQGSSRASKAPFPTPSVLEIKWNQPAQKIMALVRAASPFYGAFTVYGGQRLLVWSAQISRENSDHLPPGTLFVSGGKAEAAALDYFITLETIQHGLVRFYSGQEFVRVPGIKDGLILGTAGKEDRHE